MSSRAERYLANAEKCQGCADAARRKLFCSYPKGTRGRIAVNSENRVRGNGGVRIMLP
jgi:hypothetical protein